MILISPTSRMGSAGIRFLAAGLLSILATALPAAASVIYTTGLGIGDNPAFNATGSGKDVALEENSSGQYVMLADPFSLSADSTARDLLVPPFAGGTYRHIQPRPGA